MTPRRDPPPGPRDLTYRFTVTDNSRKRGPEGTPGNNPPKRGRPNIPQEGEDLYKKARNSRVRSAKHQANEVMLNKYVKHTEHIAPANLRIRVTPPFGGDDPEVRRQWRQIIMTAEKAMLTCQMEYLRGQAATEEANAELFLSQLRARLGSNTDSYDEAQAASATVASRVRGAELQKLRLRWVHDIQRLETEKVGLSIPRKGQGKGKRSPANKGNKSDDKGRKTLKGKRRLQNSETPNPPRGNDGTPRPGTSREPRGNPDTALLKLLADLLNKRI